MSTPAPPPPPGYVPAAPLPPVTPPPSQQARSRLNPWVLVGAVVVLVLVAGGVVLLLARSGGPVQAASVASPSATAEPTGEPTPSPISDQPTPTSEPLPTEEPTEFPTEEPTVQPTEEPTDLGVTETPTPEPTVPDGELVDFGGAVTFVLPPGWQVDQIDQGNAALISSDEAMALILTRAGFQKSTAEDVLAQYVQGALSEQIEGLKLAEVVPLQSNSANIVSAALQEYEGSLVSQQGSVPVQGVMFALLRQDGVVALADFTYLRGADIVDDVNAIMSSIAQSF
ncbi:MAG: hypothetical protein R2737_07575 [Candidatus Nanopelagicales bacterium]